MNLVLLYIIIVLFWPRAAVISAFITGCSVIIKQGDYNTFDTPTHRDRILQKKVHEQYFYC